MLEVLYEDNHLIAINKKIGDIVQGDKTGDKPLSEFVKDYIKKSDGTKFFYRWRSQMWNNKYFILSKFTSSGFCFKA